MVSRKKVDPEQEIWSLVRSLNELRRVFTFPGEGPGEKSHDISELRLVCSPEEIFSLCEIMHEEKWFVPEWYQEQYLERPQPHGPLLDYLTSGWQQGCDPSPHFSVDYYLSTYSDVRESGYEPLTHFLYLGKKEGRHGFPISEDKLEICLLIGLFDPAYYCQESSQPPLPPHRALLHYLTEGWKKGWSPSPFFSVPRYLAAHQDVRKQNIEPLTHYLEYGLKEGRFSFPNDHGEGVRPQNREAATKSRRIIFVTTEGKSHESRSNRLARFTKVLPEKYFEVLSYTSADLNAYATKIQPGDLLWLNQIELSSTLEMISHRVKEAGGRVIFDADDMAFPPESHPGQSNCAAQSPTNQAEEWKKLILRQNQTLSIADLVTTSSKAILQYLNQCRKAAILIPPSYDEESLQNARRAIATRKEEPFIRIGLGMGNRSLPCDVAMVAQPLIRILEEFPEVRLVYCPTTLDLTEFPALKARIGQLEARKIVPEEELPDEDARLDINLIPLLEGNPLSEAKGLERFMEAALVQVVTVASTTSSFGKVIQSGQNGYLASSPEEWFSHLRTLVKNQQLRLEMGVNAARSICWKFSPEALRHALLHIVESLSDTPWTRAKSSLHQILQANARGPAIDYSLADLVLHLQHHFRSRVTVVIPMYNSSDFIGETLDSILGQNLADIDLVIVDDASTDTSSQRVEDWLRQHATRFGEVQFWQNRTNQKLARTRNWAIENASTRYVYCLDSDNLLREECLSECLRAIDRTGADFIYPLMQTFGDGVEKISMNIPWSPETLRAGNWIDAMALLPRSIWQYLGGFTADTRLIGWEDYDLWCKMAEAGFWGQMVPRTLADYRVRPNSLIRQQMGDSERKRLLSTTMQKTHPWLHLPD